MAEVARLKVEPGFDMDVGGPTIAATLLRAELIDEVRLCVHPLILGAGAPFFPPVEDRVWLQLLETRTFGSGVVYLRYETITQEGRAAARAAAPRRVPRSPRLLLAQLADEQVHEQPVVPGAVAAALVLPHHAHRSEADAPIRSDRP